jgi:hypothetical protein
MIEQIREIIIVVFPYSVVEINCKYGRS